MNMRWKKKCALAGALLMGCVAVNGAEEMFDLDHVVVTPTGSEQDWMDTSLPINLIHERALQEKVAFSVAEVFSKEPGVDVVTAGPGSVHPIIRGLSGERVLVLENGIRLSEQRPGGNHVLSLDPAQIERVEVVRGPASVLYGSDAIGGVVNFITKRADEETGPEARLSGEADVQYESATEGWQESAHARFGKGRFNGYAGGVYRDTGNLETPEGELPNSAYKGGTLWGGGNWIGEQWKAFADYTYMQADIGVPGPEAFVEDLFKDEKHHRLALALQAEALTAKLEEFQVDFGWQRHERNRYRRKTTGIPDALAGDMEVNIQLDIDTFTLKPQFVYVPNEGHRITMGLDTFFETASSSRTIGDTGSDWVNPVFNGVPVIPDSTRVGAGAYIQDEMALGERWVVTPGLRADWIEARTDGAPGHQITEEESSEFSAVSGNLGVLFKLTDDLNLYANAGRAFRAPTLLELYFYGPHDVGNDIGNPDLDAETSWNFDLGVKARMDRLQATLSTFYTIVDDYIVKENQGDGDYLYMNYAKAVLYGAEAGVEFEAGMGFSVYSSLSAVRGKNDDTDGDLPGIPPLKLRYGIRYELAFGKGNTFWSEAGGTTAADQSHVGVNERQTDGYTIGDIRMGLDWNRSWSVVAAVENIADVLYQDHLSACWQEFGISDQPGRNVKVMLQFRF